MIVEPACHVRRCKHLEGVVQDKDETESTEVAVCRAFKRGIPAEVAYGDNLHLEPLEGQGNDIVYEREPD